jgi:hypothetical protein
MNPCLPKKGKLNENPKTKFRNKLPTPRMSESPYFGMSDIYTNSTCRPKKKPLRYQFDEYNVIQLQNHFRETTCISIYNQESLEDLYEKAVRFLHASSMIYSATEGSPKENNFYHLFVCYNADQVIKIPCDKNTTFGEFRKKHHRFFVPSSKVPIIQLLKIYVYDDRLREYVEEEMKKVEKTTISKLKRLFSCSLVK